MKTRDNSLFFLSAFMICAVLSFFLFPPVPSGARDKISSRENTSAITFGNRDRVRKWCCFQRLADTLVLPVSSSFKKKRKRTGDNKVWDSINSFKESWNPTLVSLFSSPPARAPKKGTQDVNYKIIFILLNSSCVRDITL